MGFAELATEVVAVTESDIEGDVRDAAISASQ
jgi:hypothetical protein